MKPSKEKKKTMLDLILTDFSIQNWAVSESTRSTVISSWRTFYALLSMDWVFCNLLIAPLGVAFWRGTWDYSNNYLDQQWCGGDLIKSNIIAATTGLVGTFIIDVWHHDMNSIAGLPGTARHTLISRLFSVLWGVLDIFLWKGVWDGIDHLAGHNLTTPAVTLSLGVTTLILTGTLRSAISFPHGICVDYPPDHVHSPTFLQSTPKDGITRRLLDATFSRCLEIAVILTWHGVWTLTDIITEETYNLTLSQSTFFSLLVGWSLGIFIFLGQFPLLWLSSRPVPWLVGRSANILYTLLTIYSTINCFRAYWYLLDIHLLIDGMDVAILESQEVGKEVEQVVTVESQVVGQVVGCLGLMVLGCSTCLHAGIFKDDFQQGVTLTYYLTSYFYIRDINCREEYEKYARVSQELNAVDKEKNGDTMHVQMA